MEGFADEAENRLDQDLLLLVSGNRTRDLQRRLKNYMYLVASPTAAMTEFAQKYKERILIEAGPPEEIAKAFQELFADKKSRLKKNPSLLELKACVDSGCTWITQVTIVQKSKHMR